MGFKEDETFARYLTMGAYAAAEISRDLEARGHRIIELERYAKANKIWSIKVKRMRLPDLLCLRCGRRFECKGKSKLELKLSHSGTVGREWWEGGMRDEDVFAFVRVVVEPDNSFVIGRIVYVTRQALSDAEPALKEGVRKAIRDGSEADVSWPSWVPSYGGTVTALTPDRVVEVRTYQDQARRYTNGAKWPDTYLHVQVGERFDGGEIVASCTAPAEVTCAGDIWNWRADLDSTDDSTRFAAVKASRWLGAELVGSKLRAIAADPDGDWRLALEAQASLTSIDWSIIRDIRDGVLTKGAPADQRMERVLVLSELPFKSAADALAEIAVGDGIETEVEAAAVWGLGLGAAPDPVRLATFTAEADDLVALHAAAALPEVLPGEVQDILIGWLDSGSSRNEAVAAHLLARHGNVPELLAAVRGRTDQVRDFAMLAIADLPRARVVELMGALDPADAATLDAMWAKEDDWLRSPHTDGGLDVLCRQRVRL